jgi:hypothetical protein
VAVTATLVPAAAAAETRNWEKPTQLTDAPLQTMRGDVAMAPGGESITVWSAVEAGADTWDVRALVKKPGEAAGRQQILDLKGMDPKVATDAAGGAIAVWSNRRRELVASVRPPGGTFGPGQVLARSTKQFDLGPGIPKIAMNARGDAVISFYYGAHLPVEQGQFWEIRRPAGGDFLQPEPISEVSELKYAFDRDVALNDDGEYVIGWSDGSLGGDPDYVRIVEARSRTGRWSGSTSSNRTASCARSTWTSTAPAAWPSCGSRHAGTASYRRAAPTTPRTTGGSWSLGGSPDQPSARWSRCRRAVTSRTTGVWD